jgi:hypothetical protein
MGGHRRAEQVNTTARTSRDETTSAARSSAWIEGGESSASSDASRDAAYARAWPSEGASAAEAAGGLHVHRPFQRRRQAMPATR